MSKIHMLNSKWYCLFSITGFILSLCSLFIHFLVYSINDKLISLRDISPELFEKLTKDSREIQTVFDSISYAHQIGRLDIVSLFLAIFGIMIALFAFGWFGVIRHEAKNIAFEAAQEETRKLCRKLIEEELQGGELRDEILEIISTELQTINDTREIQNQFSLDGINDEVVNAIANSRLDGN